jgi:hypothetical protein
VEIYGRFGGNLQLTFQQQSLRFSEEGENLCQSTRRYIPEVSILREEYSFLGCGAV